MMCLCRVQCLCQCFITFFQLVADCILTIYSYLVVCGFSFGRVHVIESICLISSAFQCISASCMAVVFLICSEFVYVYCAQCMLCTYAACFALGDILFFFLIASCISLMSIYLTIMLFSFMKNIYFMLLSRDASIYPCIGVLL